MALTFKIAVLAGDGIGPEVTVEAIAVLQAIGLTEENGGSYTRDQASRIDVASRVENK